MKGDCLEKIKTIQDLSVDSVVTDPPYGMDYQSAWRSDPEKRFKKIANDKKPFIWFLYDAFRVLKDGGRSFVLPTGKTKKHGEALSSGPDLRLNRKLSGIANITVWETFQVHLRLNTTLFGLPLKAIISIQGRGQSR